MFSYINKNNHKIGSLNFLISAIPLSFILGNTIININIAFIILSSIIFFGKDIFKIKYFFFEKLLFSFFFVILITGVINDIYFHVNDLWPTGYNTILKSIFFLRYLLLYLVIRYLIEKDFIKFKYFFISSAFFSLFVCLDIFYQAIFGKDIFGYTSVKEYRKLSGPFGDEYIAGSYIQRFSLFALFIIPIFFKHKFQRHFIYVAPILFLIFLFGIIFSGNRMPFILFLFTAFLIIILHKGTRKYLLQILIILPILFIVTYNTNVQIRDNYHSFYYNILRTFAVVWKGDYDNPKYKVPAYAYIREFSTFYDTWKMNKYIGGGIKNFRYYCHVRPNLDKRAKFKCNMHPHNYYLEILTETGIVGFGIISGVFLIVLYISFIKKYFLGFSDRDNHLMVPFIFLFISEIFPIKTSGSFFTTGNAVYIFLIMAITVGLSIKYNFIEKK